MWINDPKEFDDLEFVLRKFFKIEGDKFVQSRIAEDLQNYKNVAERNRKNGAKGGRPKKYKKTQNNPSGSKNNPNQEPRTKNQEPLEIDMAISHWNNVAEKVGWAKVKKLTSSRKSKLPNRIKDAGGLGKWKGVIQQAAKSDFLTGKSSNWKATFDFFLSESSFAKVLEGNYQNNGQSSFLSERPEDFTGEATSGKGW